MPLDWSEILTILFVVFNPLKVIGPFVALTRDATTFLPTTARRATFFAAIGVLVVAITGATDLAQLGRQASYLTLGGGNYLVSSGTAHGLTALPSLRSSVICG